MAPRLRPPDRRVPARRDADRGAAEDREHEDDRLVPAVPVDDADPAEDGEDQRPQEAELPERRGEIFSAVEEVDLALADEPDESHGRTHPVAAGRGFFGLREDGGDE